MESKLSTTMTRILLIGLLAIGVHAGAGAWTLDPQLAFVAPDTSLHATQGGISLSQATQLALQRNPGRVVRAETVERRGRRIHEVRILGADGRVRTVRVDASSGRVL